MNKLLIALVGVLCVSSSVKARILADYFNDGMVLEGYPRSASLFGRTRRPNAPITVQFSDGLYHTESDSTGHWSLRLPPTAPSFRDQYTITVQTPNEATETLHKVLFGTTLVCGGHDASMTALPTTAKLRPARLASGGSVQWNDPSATYSSSCFDKALELSQATGTPVGMIDATGYDITTLSKSLSGAIAQHFAWVGAANEDETAFRRAMRTATVKNGYIVGNGTLPRVIAHRGSASTCPENTLPSQEVARKGGAVWIEDDTHPTVDGVHIVMHDDNVDRTTDGSGPIRSLTLAEIKALDAGSWFAPSFKGTRVPTLQEQLEDLRERGGNLLLEIKSENSEEEIQNIYNIIKGENMTERVIIQSFVAVNLERMYKIAPELPLGYLVSSIDSDLEEVCTRLHLTHYNPNYGSVVAKPSTVQTLHDLGVAIYVWTPDTPTLWKKVTDLGVDGIITNRAIELIGYQEGTGSNTVNEGLFDRAPPAANHNVKFFSI